MPRPANNCRHDGTTHHCPDLPKSGDIGDLLVGDAVTLCCGSPVSINDRASTYCKCCYGTPPDGYEDVDLDALVPVADIPIADLRARCSGFEAI